MWSGAAPLTFERKPHNGGSGKDISYAMTQKLTLSLHVAASNCCRTAGPHCHLCFHHSLVPSSGENRGLIAMLKCQKIDYTMMSAFIYRQPQNSA